MAVCKKIPRTVKRVCVGALNQRIKIWLKAIEPNADYGYDINLGSAINVWSMVQTVKGVTVFETDGAGSDIARDISHIFYIRRPYPFIVDKTKLLEFKGFQKTTPDYYDVRLVEDLNEERRFLAINCSLNGQEANRNK